MISNLRCSVPFFIFLMLVTPSLQDDNCCELIQTASTYFEIHSRIPSRLIHPFSRPRLYELSRLICSNIDFSNRNCYRTKKSMYTIRSMEITNSRITEIPLLDSFSGYAHTQIIDIRIDDQFVENIQAGAFESFPNLQKLSLNRNMLVTIQENYFLNSTSLRKLVLGYNRIEKIEEGAFDSLINLNELDLRYNLISTLDSSTFDNLEHLTHLYLMNNRLEDIDSILFKNLHELDTLDLGNNRIKHVDPQAFSSNRNLHFISLSHNYLVEIPTLNLTLLGACELIDLNHNALTSVNLTDLRNVNAIDLSDTSFSFTEKSIPRSGMNVKYLNLDNTQINSKRLLHLENFNHLEILSAASNSFDDFDVMALEHMKKLTNLSLYDNFLSGLDFKNVSEKLQFLNLSRNGLSTIRGMSHLSELQQIDLSWNKIEQVTANTFMGLGNLKVLILNHNKIATLEIGCFRDLKNIDTLDLSHNQISVLPIGIFSGCTIRILKLSHNLLTDLDEGVLLNHDRKLKELDLAYNEIKYDTDVHNTLRYLNTRNNLIGFSLDIRGNDWSCGDLLGIIKDMRFVRLINGDEVNITNIRGISCNDDKSPIISDNNNNEITNDLLTSNIASGIEKFDNIQDKLTTRNILTVFVVLFLALMCVAKYMTTSHIKKFGFFTRKRNQHMELSNENGYGNHA